MGAGSRDKHDKEIRLKSTERIKEIHFRTGRAGVAGRAGRRAKRAAEIKTTHIASRLICRANGQQNSSGSPLQNVQKMKGFPSPSAVGSGPRGNRATVAGFTTREGAAGAPLFSAVQYSSFKLPSKRGLLATCFIAPFLPSRPLNGADPFCWPFHPACKPTDRSPRNFAR